jgi:transposase, IS5 family
MLRLTGGQVESLFDQLLPVEVRELPADLAALDRLLADPRLLAPIEQAWQQTARRQGRPTIPMTSFVRLMVIKQRTGWGYQTLVREVSDSLHLRRLCLLPLIQRVPEEFTVRKLVRRLGPEVVNQLTRVVTARPGGRPLCGSTRPWSRPTSAIRPTRGWPGRAPGRWPARAASWPLGYVARPGE